jgi:hypothetical protein
MEAPTLTNVFVDQYLYNARIPGAMPRQSMERTNQFYQNQRVAYAKNHGMEAPSRNAFLDLFNGNQSINYAPATPQLGFMQSNEMDPYKIYGHSIHTEHCGCKKPTL